MKEKILKLKSEGKSYKQIQEILGCSKGTISYHCGLGQKEKTKVRRDKRRDNIIKSKTDNFKYVKSRRKTVLNKKKEKTNIDVVQTTRVFQKRDNTKKYRYNKDIKTTFTWEDVISKFGEKTICYLSGVEIDLYVNNYNFDHIIPVSKGGDNSLENLGITHEIVNYMKGDLTPEELIEWCFKILKHNGYKITK